MEQKILDELLRTTFTVEAFRKKALALKKMLQKEIYSGKSDEAAKSRSDEGFELGHSSLEGLGFSESKQFADFDFSLLKGIKNNEFSAINEMLENFMKNMEMMSVYFVFTPSDEQVKEVGNWLRQNLKNQKLIYEVKVDPELIGGCAIAYKGVYKDYSLRARIDGNKEKLMEEFRKYFKH